MDKKITVEMCEERKTPPSDEDLGFGRTFTDHMFVMDYESERGWFDPRVVPYSPLEIDPAAAFCHYGQTTFEGLKAYRAEDGRVLLFRPDMNAARFNNSNERMCISRMDPEFFVRAVKKTVEVDKNWVPSRPGTSLYIRPFTIATEIYLGLKPSSRYKFVIILSPVAAYYSQGIKPTRIYVETDYVRAIKGGTGMAKTGGNYAGSLKAQSRAAEMGYDEVLWLDGVDREFVEEVGAMNVFFKIDGKIITPSLEGSILPGITRDSVIKILRNWGIKVEERRIKIQEVAEAYQQGSLEEAFGTGTAAIISPIGELKWNEMEMKINGGEAGEVASKLYDYLIGLQTGRREDPYGWTVEV